MIRKATLCLLATSLIASSFVFTSRSLDSYPWEEWSQSFQKFGPRANDVIFEWGGSNLWQQLALWGNIDIAEGDPNALMQSPEDFPNSVIESYESLSIIQIDLNNHHFPTSNVFFRRALAHLVDKDSWRILLDGKADIIQTPLPRALAEFINPNVATYSYSKDLAVQILENAGFVDHDGDGYREGPNCEEIDLIILNPSKMVPSQEKGRWRCDIDTRFPAISQMIENLEEGLTDIDIKYHEPPLIPQDNTDARVGSVVTLNVIEVLNQPRDYNIYFDILVLEPTLDYLYSLFHGSFTQNQYDPSFPFYYGLNWIGFQNSTYDLASSNLMFNSFTWEEAKQFAYECQAILAGEVAVIPLFAQKLQTIRLRDYAHHAYDERYWDRQWVHAVNGKGKGFDSYWTFLNMHPYGFERGAVIRYGTRYTPSLYLNPIFATDETTWTFLYLLYDTLMKNNPYSLSPSDYVPWLATNYNAEPYWLGECWGTKIRFNLIPSLWQDNQPLTAYDIKFSLEYLKNNGAPSGVLPAWHYSKVAYIHSVNVINDLTVEVVLKTGIIALSWMTVLPILPKHIWEGRNPFSNPADDDKLIGSGPFRTIKDGIIGKVDSTDYAMHLTANPSYFRRLVWPDVCDISHTPGLGDNWVDLDDFMEVAKPSNMFKEENLDGTWPTPCPGNWGEYCDVNKDGRTSVGDLMATGVHLAESWPPPWYDDPPRSSTQSSTHSFNQAKIAEQESLSSQIITPNNAYSEASLGYTSAPQVSAYPAIVAVPVGKTFTIDITISNVTNLYGWEFSMSFDPAVLSAIKVTESSFLRVAGSTCWLTPRMNNTAGTITAGTMLWPLPPRGATGSGTIATITFYVQSGGATYLNFSHTELNTVIYGDTVPIFHGTADGYIATTIQTAVDWANVADSVLVKKGTYYEHVTINKSLTLIGESVNDTIIDGGGTGNIVLIKANNTNISGFTMTNGLVGVHLKNSYMNTLDHIKVSNNAEGIYLEHSGNNTISDNNVTISRQWGINLEYCNNNNILGNTISNNKGGLKAKYSNNNTIYHNNFISNTDFQVSSPQSVNRWDNGIQGNYWSDYTGQDLNGDGVGDTPYRIDAKNQDNYPLMELWIPS